jgi:hypothetical protein
VRLHLSAQHTWSHFLSVCLSYVLSESPIAAQLAPVRFSNNQEWEKTRSNKGAREKPHFMISSKFKNFDFQKTIIF